VLFRVVWCGLVWFRVMFLWFLVVWFRVVSCGFPFSSCDFVWFCVVSCGFPFSRVVSCGFV